MIRGAELIKIRNSFGKDREIFLTNSFKALGDINRHRIFLLLKSKTKISASEIAETLKMSRPLTSQHLKILEQAKLFIKTKIGQHKFYELNQKNIFVCQITDLLDKLK